MESQPQNPEFRNNPENFHPCKFHNQIKYFLILTLCCSSPQFFFLLKHHHRLISYFTVLICYDIIIALGSKYVSSR